MLLEELVKLGAHTFLRIGNSGGLAPSLGLGDLVVTTGAVRDDGTSRSYVVPEYPAVADHELVGALLAAGRERGARCRAGITWSLDAFYVRNAVATPDGGMASMSAGSYWTRTHAERITDMRAARVLNCEMEAGTLLTLASLFGVRAGAICVVSDRTPWPGPAEIDLDRNMAQCIEIATAAMLTRRLGLERARSLHRRERFRPEVRPLLQSTRASGTGARFQVRTGSGSLRRWITSRAKRSPSQA